MYYNIKNSQLNKHLPFDILLPIVGIHATVDFFFTTKIDIKLHHLFVIGVIFYNYYNNVASDIRFIIVYPLIKTEISSIFLSLKEYLPKKSIWYNVNSVLFYISFLKLRIIDFYNEIIYNNLSFIEFIKNFSPNKPLQTILLVYSCYGLYMLNIYWFLIINKILYKNISKLFVGINIDKICNYICSYVHILNIPLSVFVYSQNKNEKYLFDMIGVTALSVTSYLYHYDIYKRLSENKITEYVTPDKDNIAFFLQNCIFIHVRSFLTTVTSYYNHPQILPIIFISSIIHLTSIYSVILNIFVMFIYPYKEEPKNGFLIIHNVITMLPIGLDILFIFANSGNETAIPFLSVNIAIALLFVVEPFYKLNHVAFHLILVAQNYYLCLSHRGGL